MPSHPTHVLLHTSAVHGVEGFAGSAIQCTWLEQWKQRTASHPLLPGQIAVFVHAVNPHGFAWHRRWNPQNVDLNRNCLVMPGTSKEDTLEFKRLRVTADEDYLALDWMINPATRISWGDCFLVKAAAAIAWYGMSRLKQALVGGQYHKPDGLYFGGHELQPELAHLLPELQKLGISKDNPRLRQVLHIDVHSGLGPYGVDTLLVDSQEDAAAVRSIMGLTLSDAVLPSAKRRVQPPDAEAGIGYVTTGGFIDGVRSMATGAAPAAASPVASSPKARARSAGRARGAAASAVKPDAAPAARVLSVVQEFGTRPPVTVFQAMRAELAAYKQKPDLDLGSWERAAVLDAFYPQEAAWQSEVFTRGMQLLQAFWKQTAVECEINSDMQFS